MLERLSEVCKERVAFGVSELFAGAVLGLLVCGVDMSVDVIFWCFRGFLAVSWGDCSRSFDGLFGAWGINLVWSSF